MSDERQYRTCVGSIDAFELDPVTPAARADSGITEDGLLEVDEKYAGPTWMQADFNEFMKRRKRRGDSEAELRLELQRVDAVLQPLLEAQRKQEMDALFDEVDELETRTTREQRAAQAFARRVMGADYE